MNKVIVMGRLGRDPELKYTPTSLAVCSFSVATSESWKDKSGNRQEKTEWHNIVVYGKQAENCNMYLKKGRQALVSGKLQTRSWEDKQGSKRYMTEIVAENIQFIGDASRNQCQNSDTGNYESSDSLSADTDYNFTSDDIPF